jgi:hypothetical protein
MPPRGSVKIDTIPMPEKPLSMEISIPAELIKEFESDLRIVVRHPWIIGIPVPYRFINPDLVKKLGKDFELIITPTAMTR